MSLNHFTETDTDQFMTDVFKTVYPECDKESVIAWLQATPGATSLRVSLEQTSRQEFIASLRQLLRQDYQIVPHPVVVDVVMVTSEPKEVLPTGSDPRNVVLVGSMCGASVLRGADVYAPGVQAAPSNLQINDNVFIYADHQSKVLRGAKSEHCFITNPDFINEFMFIGKGVATMSRDDLFKGPRSDLKTASGDNGDGTIASGPTQITGLAIRVTETVSNCPRLSDDDCNSIKNLYMMQNVPSTVCVHVLDPQSGEKVLDMCAAPGGKTSHIASILLRKSSNESRPFKLYACDRSSNKIQQIIETCSRLNVSEHVTAFVQDGTKIKFEGIFEAESFDKILLDAPCSALGQRPQFAQTKKLKELWSFANLQKKLFAKAVQLLKPGGVLVYSTCTITVEENEGLVAWALSEFAQLQLQESVPVIGQPGALVPGLTSEQAKMVQRFGNPKLTCPLEDSIGFFVAKFVKLLNKQ